MEQRRADYESPASRTLVASYGSYAETQRAVDHLSDNDFPVDKVSIVAEDLRFVERVTGRVGYGRAALNGLSSGAIAGALFGFVFGLFSLIDPLVSGLVLAFWGLVFGAIVGLIIGLISHALSGGQRDFSSAGQMQAGRYDIVADARQLCTPASVSAVSWEATERRGDCSRSPVLPGVQGWTLER